MKREEHELGYSDVFTRICFLEQICHLYSSFPTHWPTNSGIIIQSHQVDKIQEETETKD